MIELPYEMTNEMCQYLEDLRQSGEVNMYGAGTYLQRDFSLTERPANSFLKFWMANYKELINEKIISRG